MSAPLVSAIVSTYNAERFMNACLEDLENQTIADRIEIIVVDSNSQQHEGDIVRQFQRRYDNIRYIRTPERETLYAAWNRGIAVAAGKYLTSANTDDRHRRDALEIIVQSLENDPGAALAYADTAVTLREDDTADTVDTCVFLRWPRYDRRLFFQVNFAGSQPVWRRDLHQRYGYFDDSFVVAADYEFWLRIARFERFIHVPETLGIYLASPSSIEHRHPELTWRETEIARERYWSSEWGTRPRPRGFFLRVDAACVARRALRGNFRPLRDVLAHARMLVYGRFARNPRA